MLSRAINKYLEAGCAIALIQKLRLAYRQNKDIRVTDYCSVYSCSCIAARQCTAMTI
jgi:hypothetical protein